MAQTRRNIRVSDCHIILSLINDSKTNNPIYSNIEYRNHKTISKYDIELENECKCLTITRKLKDLIIACPTQTQLYEWKLFYSTERHGISVQTMYNRIEKIIRDKNAIFSAHSLTVNGWAHMCKSKRRAPSIVLCLNLSKTQWMRIRAVLTRTVLGFYIFSTVYVFGNVRHKKGDPKNGKHINGSAVIKHDLHWVNIDQIPQPMLTCNLCVLFQKWWAECRHWRWRVPTIYFEYNLNHGGPVLCHTFDSPPLTAESETEFL